MAADYLVIDDFLDGWLELRSFLADHASFDAARGIDGVRYPDICLDIPRVFVDEVQEKLDKIASGGVRINHIFARKSSEGIDTPHQVHSDFEWGEWSMMLYMNQLEDCIGGTSFLRHQLGFSEHPINQKQLDAWSEDANSPEKWHMYDMCEMRPNRALIFPSRLMHRAEPVGGFGKTQQDSRIVLTAFFNDQISH